jgi:hypothetical protein
VSTRPHSLHAAESTTQTRNNFWFGWWGFLAVTWPNGASNHPVHHHTSMRVSRISASRDRARSDLELLFDVLTPVPMGISLPHTRMSTAIFTRFSGGCFRSSILAREGFRRFSAGSPRMCSLRGTRSMRNDTEGVWGSGAGVTGGP